jgi:hypothetical protein
MVAEVFHAYAAQLLGPTRRPGDNVVLDPSSAHKIAPSREAVGGRRARLLSVPPDSPDLAPLEAAWSKRKTCVRTATARTRAAREWASRQAFATMTAADAHGRFRDGGLSYLHLKIALRAGRRSTGRFRAGKTCCQRIPWRRGSIAESMHGTGRPRYSPAPSPADAGSGPGRVVLERRGKRGRGGGEPVLVALAEQTGSGLI